jgi:hypothetical protein
MLNPIEGCIADIKRGIETEFATTLRPALLNIVNQAYGQRTKERERLLFQSLTSSLKVVTPELVQAHQNHMMGLIPAMLGLEDAQKRALNIWVKLVVMKMFIILWS